MDKPFLTDIKELRQRACSHIEEGAVTEAYRADRDTVLRILNEARRTSWPSGSPSTPTPT
jgi:bacterioferritin